jgi:hypothetical protein
MDDENIRVSLAASPGDRILVKIKNDLIVNVYEDLPDAIVSLEIICICDEGYLAFIPTDFYLKNSFIIDVRRHREYNVPKQFIGGTAHYLTNQHIYAIQYRATGMVCAECLEHSPMAEANQEDGSFICWNCRSYPSYR